MTVLPEFWMEEEIIIKWVCARSGCVMHTYHGRSRSSSAGHTTVGFQQHEVQPLPSIRASIVIYPSIWTAQGCRGLWVWTVRHRIDDVLSLRQCFGSKMTEDNHPDVPYHLSTRSSLSRSLSRYHGISMVKKRAHGRLPTWTYSRTMT